MLRRDHEDIVTDQMRMAASLSDRKPSEVVEVYWLYAENESAAYPQATDNSGKWLVFVDAHEVDEVWSAVAKATREGRLGGRSKVATAAPNGFSQDPTKRVICVYTYDWKDVGDVKRVREVLHQLGVNRKIAYKSDEDSMSGKYRVTGHSQISKYYE